MSDEDKILSVLPSIEDLALMSDDEKLRRETVLMIEEVISSEDWKDFKERIMEIIDDQSKKAMKIDQNAKRDESLNQVSTPGEISTTRDAHSGPSTITLGSASTSATIPLTMRTLPNRVSQRSSSPEYDEISDTKLDVFVSKDLDNKALAEMNHKIEVLKTICEQVSDKAEKEEHFIALYQEYATWCEARIDTKMVMHFLNRFHVECSAYLLLYHKIEVDIQRFEDELLRRTDNSQWTDAQKLKRKVLQRRKSNV